LPGRWQPTAEASHDAERHAQRFDRLRREVEAANRRARSWLYVGLAVLAGGAAVAAMAISDPLLAWVGLS
jgi:hypothetical protein